MTIEVLLHSILLQPLADLFMLCPPGCFEGIQDPLILRVPFEITIAREILSSDN